MTNEEIRDKIVKLNKDLVDSTSLNSFILNKKITEIEEQIKELQGQCTHSFVNGFCKYCYKDEDKR